ncbi:putative porin, partial [Flavobacteriaceae bacterium]|nr:putative porin [Flavobacteriaceae bacterium]
MRSGVFILFLILYHSVWGQEAVINVKDSLPVPEEIIENKKDSILIVDKIIKDKSIDSLTIKDKLSKSKAIDSTSKRFIPYIKPMERVTVEDYKILHFDGSETIVDTTLSLEGEYAFNFLRKDYFELLPLPNMGEGFNKLGYDFHEDPLTPQMGARVKHFGYFEKEDVNYYEVPSPYTELFFKSTFQNGQNLDATLAINTSPKFNIAVSFKGFRSLGKYFSSLSRSRQFRLSTQYQTYDKRYRLRLHQTTQSLENEVNGGLTNDAVYFFENAPNYVVADTSGIP